MCTLTFFPKSDDNFILTSNRDESPGRKTFPPKIYHEDNVELLYPRDAVAGGTWIGVSQRKRVISLMNGGFVDHKRKASYARSRGLIVKDLLTTQALDSYLNTYDFSEIEPFTAIAVEYEKALKIYEIVWTGEELVFTKQPLQPKIWSSSPLYPEELAQKRELWFSEFYERHKDVSSKDLISFHQTAGEGDPISNIVMDRGFVKTKSITQIVKSIDAVAMRYYDLETGKMEASSLIL